MLFRSAFMRRLTNGDGRRAASLNALSSFGSLSAQEVTEQLFALLRSHKHKDARGAGEVPGLCCHDYDLLGNPSTASLAVSIPEDSGNFIVWFTGASYPCANLYKPVLCSGGSFIPLWETYDYSPHGKTAAVYWKYRRDKARRIQRSPQIGRAHV